MQIPKIVCITEGEYDDYHIVGHYIDRNLKAAFGEWIKSSTPLPDNGYSTIGFTEWCVDWGYLDRIDAEEVHIGEYGRLDKRIYCKHEELEWGLFSSSMAHPAPFANYMMQRCKLCRESFPETIREPLQSEVDDHNERLRLMNERQLNVQARS